MYGICTNLEQCLQWGATSITLLSIQGDLGTNMATHNAWELLLDDLQEALIHSKLQGQWEDISYLLVNIATAEHVVTREASGDGFVVIASCPNQHFATITALMRCNRNILCSLARANDESSLCGDAFTQNVQPPISRTSSTRAPRVRPRATDDDIVSASESTGRSGYATGVAPVPTEVASERFAWARGLAASDVDGKIAAYRQCVAIDPTHTLAWNNLGLLLEIVKGNSCGAEDAYRKAISCDANFSDTVYNLGTVLNNSKKCSSGAKDVRRKAIVCDPDHETGWHRSGSLRETSDKEDALSANNIYREGIIHDAKQANKGILFRHVLQKNKILDTEASYNDGLSCDPKHAIVWCNLGSLLQNTKGDTSGAEDAYRKAIACNPDYAPAWNSLGSLLQNSKGDILGAEGAYRNATTIDPKYAIAWYNFRYLLQTSRKDMLEAEDAYRKVIIYDPQCILAWVHLGLLLKNFKNDISGAEDAYREAIAIDTQCAGAWNNLGYLLENSKSDISGAEHAYRKALDCDPTYVLAWNNLGYLLKNFKRDMIGAEDAYRKAITIDPRYAKVWYNLGYLLQTAKRDISGATTAYRKCIDCDPSYKHAAWIRAHCRKTAHLRA